jgi:hypothetical protein
VTLIGVIRELEYGSNGFTVVLAKAGSDPQKASTLHVSWGETLGFMSDWAEEVVE